MEELEELQNKFMYKDLDSIIANAEKSLKSLKRLKTEKIEDYEAWVRRNEYIKYLALSIIECEDANDVRSLEYQIEYQYDEC